MINQSNLMVLGISNIYFRGADGADVAKCIIQTLGRGSIEIGEFRNEQHEANLLQLNCDKAR